MARSTKKSNALRQVSTTRPRRKRVDRILLVAIGLLVAVGLLALLSASISESKEDLGNVYGYFTHQLVFGVLGGVIAGAVAYFVPYQITKKLALPFFLVGLLLLILIFVPGIGVSLGGARRWINLGIIDLQPAEVVKVGFTLYLAAWLDTHYKELKEMAVLVPFLILLGILALLLILQPNFSSLLLISAIGIAMYFAAGAPVRYIAGLGVIGVLGSLILVKVAPYRFNRILAFLDPSSDPLGISYQINQAFISIGSGRWFGTGLFQGIQKQTFLPEPMNDSIYAVWAEETGFIGASLLVILFLVFLWRTFAISERAQDRFIKYASLGIGVWIFLQASINIGAMVGVVPLTGMPLPFISYGSSSLIAVLAASGLLLQFSKETSS